MAQASKALNTQEHLCCFHGEHELQGAAELQNGDGFLPDLRLLQKDGDGLSQKMKKSGDAIFQAVGLTRRKHGIPAKSRKPKKKRVYVFAKTRWSAEETEALLKAIESCTFSDDSWSLKANKWELVLQHMQARGFSEKNTFTVQKKYQNIHWAFRNLKAWRVRNKRPLFENLTTSERVARLLPRSFCPELYARMETFFATTGLDDGVSMVRDQDHVSIHRIRKSPCGTNDEEDDEDDEDDDDDDPNYRIGGASLPSIKSHRKPTSSLDLCLHAAEGSKRGKEQYRKPQFWHGSMRGCLLTEGMDLVKAFEERGLHDGDDGGAKGNGENYDIGDDDSKNVDDDYHDDDASGNGYKRGQPCADKYGDNLTQTGCKRKKLTHSPLCSGVLDNAMNLGMNSQKEQGINYTSCGDAVGGQISISDGKSHAILQHIASTDKQLSDYIQAVKMSIQTVNLLLDNC